MCGKKRKSQSPPASPKNSSTAVMPQVKLANGCKNGVEGLTPSDKDKSSTWEEWRNWSKLIVWRNVIIMTYIHIVGTYGFYIWFSGQLYWTTIVIGFTFGYMTSFGVTAGAHRLWAHKCYKAKLPLRIILCIMQTVGCQNSIYTWCRDHSFFSLTLFIRYYGLHHRHSETDADPHNVNRGFFFAHVGWLLMRKHEDVKTKGKGVDMSDLEKDPVVMFQKKYFVPLTLLGCFYLPYQLAVWFGEDPMKAWNMVVTRYMLTLNFTWLVNSAAHLWGPKPYDKNIHAVENKFVSGLAVGEGWHNYHHIFPWDYKAAELTTYNHNWATAFIDFFAWIGWAYDLKTVPERVVLQRVRRTGDGSHAKHNEKDSNLPFSNSTIEPECNGTSHHNTWGWDDPSISKEERDITVILKQKNA